MRRVRLREFEQGWQPSDAGATPGSTRSSGRDCCPTGELAGKGVTCKVRKGGEAGQLFAQQVSSPLINVAAAAAERGRNILCDRGEQAVVDLTVPLFPRPLKAGEIGVILPLDLVQVLSSEGTWHGQCESIRIEVVVDQQAVVIEQTATLERHFTDAD